MNAPLRRYELLDAFRGAAALWVLWCHSISWEYTHLNRQNVLFNFMCRFMEYGYLGVPIFFMISGYGISWSIEHHASSAWAFLKRRAMRIYPAYWISMILILTEVFLIISLRANHNAALPNWRDVLLALPLLNIPNLPRLNPVYWTLGYDMHFYLLATLAVWLFRRRPFVLFDLFTVAVLAERHGYFSVGWDQFFILRHYWLDFYCGNLLYRCLYASPRWPGILYPSATLLALAILNRPPLPVRFEVGPLLAFALLCAYPADGFLCRTKAVSAFRSLGRLSYSLFLTNVMVGPKFIGLVDRLVRMNNAIYLVALALGTAGSILWAYAFFRWVEYPLALGLGSKASGQLK